jgi:hypothetical protein
MKLGILIFIGLLLLVWSKDVYSIGDIHGEYEKTVKLLQLSKLMDDKLNWIGGEAVLVQTGDILDRGKNGTEVLQLLLSLRTQAKRFGGDVILLLGNHELMNLMNEFSFVNEDELTADYKIHFSPSGKYGRILLTHPTTVIIDDVLYVHAGLSPRFAQMGIDRVNADVTKFLKNEKTRECENEYSYNCIMNAQGPFWTRIFGGDENDTLCALVEQTHSILKVKRTVLGHTAANHIEYKCNVKLIKIDIGLQFAKVLSMLRIKDGVVSEIRLEESGHIKENHMVRKDEL